MCFYCHKLYYDPEAPIHSSSVCPHLIKQYQLQENFMKKYYQEIANKKDK